MWYHMQQITRRISNGINIKKLSALYVYPDILWLHFCSYWVIERSHQRIDNQDDEPVGQPFSGEIRSSSYALVWNRKVLILEIWVPYF